MPERNACVRGGAVAATRLLVFALVLGLSGCGWLLGIPVLDVSPTTLDLDSQSAYDGATLTISNIGAPQSTLSFRIVASDPRLRPTPATGALSGGDSLDIGLDVAAETLDIGDALEGNLTVFSNGGQETVRLVFVRTVGGLGSCGTFPMPRTSTAPSGNLRQGAAAAPAPERGYVPGQVLVGYVDPLDLPGPRPPPDPDREGGAALGRGDASVANASAFRARVAEGVRTSYGLRSIAPTGPGAELVYAADPDAVIERLRSDPRVRYAERNAYVALQKLPNDPLLESNQWNLVDFGLPKAWDLETGDGADVTIAIIDSGVQLDHPDLARKMLPGCDFNGNDNDPNPGPVVTGDTAHGTHVAGIAAASGEDLAGVAGVAYGAGVHILPVKIFDDTGTRATVDQLARAIRWSVGIPVAGVAPNPNPADIVNMSLGVPGRFQTLDDATEAAWQRGALLVAAAGNHVAGSGAGVLSPANGPRVLAVGSVDADREPSYFSNTGPELDLMAPGGSGPSSCFYVLSTIPFDDYGCEAGTSMAAPFVSGEAALLLSQLPSRSNQELRDRILAATLPIAGTPSEVGSGLACVDLALGAASRCGAATGP